MRKFGLMAGLALVAIACATGADMVVEMMDSGVPDAGAQDTPVECNKSEDYQYDGVTFTQRWAEFPVTPGQTEVTICAYGDSDEETLFGRRDFCYRNSAKWIDGTSTGFVYCGVESVEGGWISNPPKSITVHN